MTTTYAIRTAVLMPMLPAAHTPAQAPLCGTALSGLGASDAGTRARTGLVAPYAPFVDERHVAAIGTSQVVTPVIGSGVVGSVFDGTDVVPALRTWRPPV